MQAFRGLVPQAPLHLSWSQSKLLLAERPRHNALDSALEAGERRRKIPYPPTRTAPHRPSPQYRTVQQIDTVLSDKNCRPGRQIRPSSWGQPTLFETTVDESPAKAEIFGSVSTQKGIPYSPTSFTVLSSKSYRTLRQRIPYRPAKHSVLSGKIDARYSCKTG